MPSCIVSGCANRSDPKRKRDAQLHLEKSKKISYHKFPKCPQTWLTALRLCGWIPSKTATICSEHFADSDFDNFPTIRKLKKTAVPSIYPLPERSTSPASFTVLEDVIKIEPIDTDESSDNETASVNVPASIDVPADVPVTESEEVPGIASEELPVTASEEVPVTASEELPVTASEELPVTASEEVPVTASEEVYGTPTSLVRASVGEVSIQQKIDSSTSITPKSLFCSPENRRIQEIHRLEIKSLRTQLYRSRQQQVRYKKKIQTLNKILLSLKEKNLLGSEDLNIIENSLCTSVD